MPRKFIPVGTMKTDTWGWGSEGAWMIDNMIPFGDTYTSIGRVNWNSSEFTDATLCQGAFIWKTSFNSKRRFVATGTDIYELGVGVQKTGLTNDTYYGMFFAPYGPSIFATNGVDPIQVSTTGTFADIAPTAVTGNTFADIRPKFLITFKNQLIAANITVHTTYGEIPAGEYPHLVWWSARGDGEMWGDFSNAPDIDGTNYIPIFDDSIEITGLAAGEDCVFVFKEHSIHRLDGPDYALSPVSASVGCVAPKTICKLGKKIYFLSQNGIYSLDASSGELVNIGLGSVSRTLTGDNAIPECTNAPFESTLTPTYTYKIGIGIADKTVSMAVDPDNAILCLAYRPFGTGTIPSSEEIRWRCVIYNINTEQFSFGSLDFTSLNNVGAIVEDLHVINGIRTATTNFPLGNLRFVCSDTNTGEYQQGNFDVYGCDSRSISYVRWPFSFYNPEAEVKIVSVKPIFDHTFYSSGTLLVRAYVTTVNNIGGNYLTDGVVWQSIGVSNDYNFTFDSPFASRHSIAVEFEDQAGGSYIFNLVGIEVEYEEKVLGSK